MPVLVRVPSALTMTPSNIIEPSSGRALFNPRVNWIVFTESETTTAAPSFSKLNSVIKVDNYSVT